MALKYVCQGVNYSQKFCSKCSFPNFFNNRTAQFMFPKYGIEYQNVKKIVKSNFKSDVVTSIVFLKYYSRTHVNEYYAKTL